MTPKNRLIIALDVATVKEAENAIADIGSAASFYKIGHQLAFAGGLELARDLASDGTNVFLDMKLLDIDNTITKGVENIVKMGVTMTTLHAYPHAMKAAVEAARGSNLCLLGVTVLTCLDDTDLGETGYALSTAQLVAKRATQAKKFGMGGLVASAHEAQAIRKITGEEMAIVTPGIRPSGGSADDQKRIMTPQKAIQSGASHLVVGRPIMQAQDKKQAAQNVVDEITAALN